MKENKKELSLEQIEKIIEKLRIRFEKNMDRHQNMEWNKVQAKLKKNKNKLWSINEMEKTGGEPDVVDYNENTNEYIFFDCSEESPKGRRNICYDLEGMNSRKEQTKK